MIAFFLILQIYESIICNTRSYKYVSKLPGGYLCRKTIDCHDEKEEKNLSLRFALFGMSLHVLVISGHC